MNLLLITTGGTIDGADLEKNEVRMESSLVSFLTQDRSLIIETHNLCNKDSREITEDDRKGILRVITSSPISHVLIGHGTYTICETGRFLKSTLKDTKKSIILLGAWIPFGDPSSDASTQTANAIRFLREEKPGVYIGMDGRLWDPDVTEKKRTAGGAWQLVSEFEKSSLL